MTPPTAQQALVSVIVEGYNEVQIGTSVDDTIRGLLEQDYPLDRIEVLLIGSTDEQSALWSSFGSKELPFHRVLPVDARGMPYYALKNRGAQLARGEVLAFTDSDVIPEPTWVSSIADAIARGADATAGVSRMRHIGRIAPPPIINDVVSSICFGHTVADDPHRDLADARALVAHNLGVRAETFRTYCFDTTQYGRNVGPLQLFEDLRTGGANVSFVPGQRARHSYTLFTWFIFPFQTRVGYEEHVGRRAVPTTHTRWLMRTGPMEPILTALLCVGWDVKAFLRFSRAERFGALGTTLRIPVLLALSLTARTSGMLGGFGGMVAPERMKAWAERH